MDLEHDWKAARTEAARADQVARDNINRRITALESACRYEVEQHGKARDALAHLELCRRDEVATRDQAIAHRDRVIAKISATVGTLRAELAAAMRTIEAWTADRTPKLPAGLRRCEASFRGIDLVVDYDVVPGIDDSGADCEAAETVTVWLGATNVSMLLSDEADDSLSEQAQQELDDWCADERDELATSGVLSLREAQEVAA